jgi:erythritol kinase (D-erythritol 1-phosphate-forming)
MTHHADILLGLDFGTSRVVAAAFTTDGHEIAHAALACPVERAGDGAAEQGQGEAWQRAAAVLRQLGEQVPRLARRTQALALTGPAGGCWLCDEDGDAVAPAILPADRRTAGLVEEWRACGLADEVARTTGSTPEASSQNAQVAWLAAHRPQWLDQAASVLGSKDWLYLCLTGERASEASAALADFGNLESDGYDFFLLERLGLQEVMPLLPAIVDGTRHHGALTPAAAAATALAVGTSVVLGPVDSVARGVAAGLGGSGAIGAGDPAPGGLHVRAWRQRPLGGWTTRGVALRRSAGLWFGLVAQPRAPGPDWLVGLAEQLLADAGLIGVPRSEIVGLLEQKAQAAPGVVRWRRDAAGWSLSGLSDTTTFYDLLRASHELIGHEARACHAALDHRPEEVRLVGERMPAAGTLAMLGVPVRRLLRTAPAATGAALTAALNLGVYPDFAAAEADWVLPYLGD